MELYSLEDESAGDMFLTQETSNILPLVPNFGDKDGMECDSRWCGTKCSFVSTNLFRHFG